MAPNVPSITQITCRKLKAMQSHIYPIKSNTWRSITAIWKTISLTLALIFMVQISNFTNWSTPTTTYVLRTQWNRDMVNRDSYTPLRVFHVYTGICRQHQTYKGIVVRHQYWITTPTLERAISSKESCNVYGPIAMPYRDFRDTLFLGQITKPHQKSVLQWSAVIEWLLRNNVSVHQWTSVFASRKNTRTKATFKYCF